MIAHNYPRLAMYKQKEIPRQEAGINGTLGIFCSVNFRLAKRRTLDLGSDVSRRDAQQYLVDDVDHKFLHTSLTTPEGVTHIFLPIISLALSSENKEKLLR